MKLITFALSAVVLTCTSLCSAQRDKQPMQVTCTNDTNDFVGERFCSTLRDEIARSPRYETSTTGTRWRIQIVTLADVATPKDASIQAVVLTMKSGTDADDLFIQQWAFQTGTRAVKDQAQTLLSSVDSEIQGLIDAYNASKNK
jgi:hypothetical protein